MGSLPKLRDAEISDYAEITALEARHGLETKRFDEWKHLWLDNPAYTEYADRLPIGWVLEGEARTVTGYLGNIPLFYEFEGQRLLASVAHSWVVDTPYRTFAPLLLDAYFSQPVVDLFLNATVGPAASECFASFQSLPVPVGRWDRSVFWITNYPGFLASSLALKRIPFAKPLGYLACVGPLTRGIFQRSERSRRGAGESSLRICTNVDDRFDTFWDALRNRRRHLLLGLRTREILDWHFSYAFRDGKAWIITATEGSAITAYAIFRDYDNPTVGLRRVRLVDYQALEPNNPVLTSILSWALKRCRREGIHMLETIGFHGPTGSVIEESAPYSRQLPSWLYFYRARDKKLAEALSDPSVWDPSQLDGDASL